MAETPGAVATGVVLETTWYGGHNNAQVSRAGTVLAVSPATATFHHRAKVRLDEDGVVRGAWWNDTVKRQDPRWERFRTGRIPAALYEQALAEQEARSAAPVTADVEKW